MSRRRPHEAPPEAIDKYREFHRFDPRRIGAMPHLRIPSRMKRAGVAKWVTYRSMKVDPETKIRPRQPVDYIHEHDAGVHVYLPDASGTAAVPTAALEATALVKLGECLGYLFVDSVVGKEREAIGQAPLPELYCTPDGTVLLVVQGKRELLAAMWGGALGVFARGIDG